jgi:hypothetical protein
MFITSLPTGSLMPPQHLTQIHLGGQPSALRRQDVGRHVVLLVSIVANAAIFLRRRLERTW